MFPYIPDRPKGTVCICSRSGEAVKIFDYNDRYFIEDYGIVGFMSDDEVVETNMPYVIKGEHFRSLNLSGFSCNVREKREVTIFSSKGIPLGRFHSDRMGGENKIKGEVDFFHVSVDLSEDWGDVLVDKDCSKVTTTMDFIAIRRA